MFSPTGASWPEPTFCWTIQLKKSEPRWSSELCRPPNPRKASPAAELNESFMVATPAAEEGRAENRIAGPGPGATVTINCRPDGSFVDTVSSTPSPLATAATTSRAEYWTPVSNPASWLPSHWWAG
jgi:hypothetical protein